MKFSIIGSIHRLDTPEKKVVAELVPQMVGIGSPEHLPVTVNTLRTQSRQIQFFYRSSVKRGNRSITHHCPHFLYRTQVIAVAISFIGSFARVSAFIHRPCRSLGARNFYNENVFAIHLQDIHPLVQNHIMAYFLAVVHQFPESVFCFFRITKTLLNIKITIVIFFHAQQNNPTIRIGKCGIGFPQRIGETTFAAFRFQMVTFSLLD